jgi:hypothetical protein
MPTESGLGTASALDRFPPGRSLVGSTSILNPDIEAANLNFDDIEEILISRPFW